MPEQLPTHREASAVAVFVPSTKAMPRVSAPFAPTTPLCYWFGPRQKPKLVKFYLLND